MGGCEDSVTYTCKGIRTVPGTVNKQYKIPCPPEGQRKQYYIYQYIKIFGKTQVNVTPLMRVGEKSIAVLKNLSSTFINHPFNKQCARHCVGAADRAVIKPRMVPCSSAGEILTT